MIILEQQKQIIKPHKIESWNKLWKLALIEQDLYGKYLFYNHISCIIDIMNFKKGLNRNLDLRSHILFISPTASGKDEGVILVKNVFKKLNALIELGDIVDLEIIYYLTENDVTDATLVGSIDVLAISYNKKNKFIKGMKGYKDIAKKGILSYTHHLSATEAKEYFKTHRYAEKTLTHIRELTNKERKVTKGLSQVHNINFYSPTTLLLCVQPIHVDILELIHDGTIGRFFIHEKKINEDTHNKIINAIITDTLKTEFTLLNKITSTDEFKNYIEYLKNTISWYKKNFNQIELEKDLDKYTREKVKAFQEQVLKGMMTLDRELILGYIRLCTKNLSKLIRLDAISNHKSVIRKENVDNVFYLYKSSIITVKQTIQKTGNEKKKIFYVVQSILKQHKQMTKEQLKKEIHNRIGFGRNKSTDLIADFIMQGILLTEKQGKTHYIKLNEKYNN